MAGEFYVLQFFRPILPMTEFFYLPDWLPYRSCEPSFFKYLAHRYSKKKRLVRAFPQMVSAKLNSLVWDLKSACQLAILIKASVQTRKYP